MPFVRPSSRPPTGAWSTQLPGPWTPGPHGHLAHRVYGATGERGAGEGDTVEGDAVERGEGERDAVEHGAGERGAVCGGVPLSAMVPTVTACHHVRHVREAGARSQHVARRASGRAAHDACVAAARTLRRRGVVLGLAVVGPGWLGLAVVGPGWLRLSCAGCGGSEHCICRQDALHGSACARRTGGSMRRRARLC